MPKARRANGQAFLFGGETTDDVVRKTFESKDEKAFKREQRRKNAGSGTQPIPTNGPCCDRCQSYRHAFEGEEFGRCNKISVVAERVVVPGFGVIEKGSILGRDEIPGVPMDALRCKPWGGQGCSAFAKTEAQAA